MSPSVRSASLFFLYGPPGSGKSSVGTALAAALNLPFVDLDTQIETSAGKAISEIFQDRGEKHFRRLEKDALAKAAALPSGVIALGGGALLDPANRRLAEKRGTVAVLFADAGVLAARLEIAHAQRPLLTHGADWRQSLADLLKSRADHYRSFPIQVPGDGNVESALIEIQRLLGAFHIKGMSQGYDIRTANGLLHNLGASMRDLSLEGPVVLVSDRTVWARHGRKTTRTLAASGYQVKACVLPGGEKNKTIRAIERIWESMNHAQMDRGSTLIALGGGVVGDLAGFAAATYLRGLHWVSVPTSLIAMVDSGLGGKTGFDLKSGKNLVGAFHPPSLVLVDPLLLETLPVAERINGMAEVIKHGLISDPVLWDLCALGSGISTRTADAWETLVRRALAVKAEVIEADPYEKSIRKKLNLGHTLGHAFEAASGFRLPHGHAVAIGMYEVSRLAAAHGLCASEMPALIKAMLEENQLPWQVPQGLDKSAFLRALFADKKRVQGQLRFVIPQTLGLAKFDVILPIDFNEYAREMP